MPFPSSTRLRPCVSTFQDIIRIFTKVAVGRIDLDFTLERGIACQGCWRAENKDKWSSKKENGALLNNPVAAEAGSPIHSFFRFHFQR